MRALTLAALTLVLGGCPKKAPPVPAGDPVEAASVSDRLDTAAEIVGDLRTYMGLIEAIAGSDAPDLDGWETCLAERIGHDVLAAASDSAAGWSVNPAIAGFTVDYTACLPDLPASGVEINTAGISRALSLGAEFAIVIVELAEVDQKDPCLSLYLKEAFGKLPALAGDIVSEIADGTRTGTVSVATIPLATEACSAE